MAELPEGFVSTDGVSPLLRRGGTDYVTILKEFVASGEACAVREFDDERRSAQFSSGARQAVRRMVRAVRSDRPDDRGRYRTRYVPVFPVRVCKRGLRVFLERTDLE